MGPAGIFPCSGRFSLPWLPYPSRCYVRLPPPRLGASARASAARVAEPARTSARAAHLPPPHRPTMWYAPHSVAPGGIQVPAGMLGAKMSETNLSVKFEIGLGHTPLPEGVDRP